LPEIGLDGGVFDGAGVGAGAGVGDGVGVTEGVGVGLDEGVGIGIGKLRMNGSDLGAHEPTARLLANKAIASARE